MIQTDEPKSTMGILQNELEKKWRREELESKPKLGPDPARRPEEWEAHYQAMDDLEAGDELHWNDGVVSEVLAVFKARQDGELLEAGMDIVHFHTPEEDAQNTMYGWSIAEDVSRGNIEVVSGAE